jgi:hypothetical protein
MFVDLGAMKCVGGGERQAPFAPSHIALPAQALDQLNANTTASNEFDWNGVDLRAL